MFDACVFVPADLSVGLGSPPAGWVVYLRTFSLMFWAHGNCGLEFMFPVFLALG